MTERNGAATALVALLLSALGFIGGAVGSAWRARERRADPWRKMRVEHEGTVGFTTRTRVIFENPKLPLQAVEVVRSPDGKPEVARVSLRAGEELTAVYEDETRPKTLEASDGSKAHFSYQGIKARVVFVASDGKELGDKTVTVPVELRSALRLSQSGGFWIGEAWAQEDAQVTVQKHVEVKLDVKLVGANDAGKAQIEATCPPLTCVPVTREVAVPGETTVRIAVSSNKKKSELGKLTDKSAIEPFKGEAREERSTADKVLPDVATVVAAVGVVSSACRSLKLTGPLCVIELGSSATGAAIHSVQSHQVDTEGPVINKRAEELYYVEKARAALDAPNRVELCLNREGFARACSEIDARPFAKEPPAPVKRAIELRRGIGGTLVGSFVLLQSDGGDCKFSPSPRTNGELRLTFDNEKNVITASMKTDQRGTRPDLRCSLGTANMSWSQSYNVSGTQSVTQEQLQSGGKLPLQLTGTMSGNGNYSFTNCRSSGGGGVDCPAGKRDSYSYPIEILGELDLRTQKGGGRIVVKNAPLATNGTWRIPAEEAPK